LQTVPALGVLLDETNGLHSYHYYRLLLLRYNPIYNNFSQ